MSDGNLAPVLGGWIDGLRAGQVYLVFTVRNGRDVHMRSASSRDEALDMGGAPE